MKNKINYYDTPQEKNNNPLFVKWMSYLLGFSKPMKKVFKQIERIEKDSKYENEPIESNIFNHEI